MTSGDSETRRMIEHRTGGDVTGGEDGHYQVSRARPSDGTPQRLHLEIKWLSDLGFQITAKDPERGLEGHGTPAPDLEAALQDYQWHHLG